MRLIDADALIKEIIEARRKAKTLTYVDMKWLVERQPTIDAEPVDGAPHLVPLEELINGAGVGYEENWLKGEDGEEDSFEVNRCAWCNGSVVLNDSEYVSSKLLERHYNRPYGLRVWSGMPSAGQREATPWAGD